MDHGLGVAKSSIHIAAFAFECVADIAAQLRMHQRRVGFQRSFGERNCRLRIELDLHKVGRVTRQVRRLGDDSDDGHADRGDIPTRQRWLRRHFRERQRNGRYIANLAQFVGRGDRDHARQLARRLHVDPDDARRRVRRAHQCHGQHPWRLDVFDVAPQPLQKPRILHPAHAFAHNSRHRVDRRTRRGHTRQGSPRPKPALEQSPKMS